MDSAIIDKPTFDEAVAFAKERMESMQESWENPATVSVWAYDILPPTRRSHFLLSVLADSKTTKLAWDVLSLIAQNHLRERTPLPPELGEWVAEVLAGNWPRPTRGEQKMSGRDRLICLVVWEICDKYGLKPKRSKNPAWAKEYNIKPEEACYLGGSACDVVGEAMKLGFSAIAKCWDEHNRNLVPNYQKSKKK